MHSPEAAGRSSPIASSRSVNRSSNRSPSTEFTSRSFASELSEVLAGSEDQSTLHTLRHVFCAGEGWQRAEDFSVAFHARLWNIYAPPELGLEVAAHECRPSDTHLVIPIGRPTILPVQLLDEARQPVPIGVQGRRGSTWGMNDSRSRRGRRLNDGSMDLSAVTGERAWTEASASIQRAGRGNTPPSFRGRLRGDRPRAAGRAACVVAYVVPPGTAPVQELESQLEGALSVPATIVPVASIPLTVDGRVDALALTRIEVIDTNLLERCKAHLMAAPGIEQAALLVVDRMPTEERLHLSDSPDRPLGTRQSKVPPRDHPNPRSRLDCRSIPTSICRRRPAVACCDFDGAPKTLTRRCRRTAADPAQRGVVYVESDGSMMNRFTPRFYTTPDASCRAFERAACIPATA